MKNLRMTSMAAVVVASSALTACWIDDDQPPEPAAGAGVSVPDSAGASSASFVSFLAGLAVGDETSQPLLVPDSFSVPADESPDVKPLG